MSGRPQQLREPAPLEPLVGPRETAQGRFSYTKYGRHRRNRQYRILAAVIVLAVGVGVLVTLLLNRIN